MNATELPAILILAGGAGTRLWPVSTDENPKQFLPIFDGESLLQKTWSRLRRLTTADRIFVSTNARYAAVVGQQLSDLSTGNILPEPARRNTGPAIAWSCAQIDRKFPGSTIAIFPSDHAVRDEEAFAVVIRRAVSFAGARDFLVTIALEPTEPSPAFGYLQLGDALEEGIARVNRFVEKPDARRALEFLESGNFAWNGGMFVWRQRVFRAQLEESAPEIAQTVQKMLSSDGPELRALYEAMPSISIDYAVMERARDVAAVSAGRIGWSDVGSWKAVAQIAPGAGDHELFLEDAEDVWALSMSGKPIGVVGLRNIAVIESPDGVLVIDLEKSELLARLAKRLDRPQADEP